MPASSGSASIVPFSFQTDAAFHWLAEPLGSDTPAAFATARVSCAQS